MMEAVSSSETSVFTRAIRRNIPEDGNRLVLVSDRDDWGTDKIWRHYTDLINVKS
jgi:hypothetical protein